MAIDPNANFRFKTGIDERKALDDTFKPGAHLTVSGVLFSVVSNEGNQLILRPVSARIS
jgi:hypothetical protein